MTSQSPCAHSRSIRKRRPSLVAWCILAFAAASPPARADFDPPVVIRNVHLIQSGDDRSRVSIVIQEGRFTAVAPDAAAPAGADEIDGADLIAYPGFIDAATDRGYTADEPTAAQRRAREDEPQDAISGPLPRTSAAYRHSIHPTWCVEDRYDASSAKLDEHRRAGFTTGLAIPPSAVLAGRSAVLELGERPLRRSILRPDVALHAALYPGAFSFDGEYPVTTAGAVALFRQTILDAGFHRAMRAWSASSPTASPRPADDPDLDSLVPALDGRLPVAFFADDEDAIIRALDRADEFKLKPLIIGGAQAWKTAARLKQSSTPVILSLSLPDEPKTPKPMTHPLLRATSQPASEPASRPSADAPLFGDDWESQPFEPLGVYQERTRLWHEVVDNAIVLHREGIPFAFSTRGTKSPDAAIANLRKIIERGLSPSAAVDALTIGAARILGVDKECGSIAPGKYANLVLMTGPLESKESKTKWLFIEGKRFEFDARAGADKPSSRPATQASSAPASAPASQPSDYPGWAFETQSDRTTTFHTAANVLLRGATLLTITHGDLPNTDLLIRDGDLAAIGTHLDVPPGTVVIDIPGYFVCPGIIDCHSHMGVSGGLNEASQSVTPEVRMADVVNHDDVSLYRALAGGVTMIHAMHGSANTIGGQCVTLRLKWTRPSSEMIVPAAPHTVKFALGENVKRSNSRRGNDSRFPASRMGVETTLRRSFDEARRYRDQAARADAEHKPFRRDLRLEALGDIMDGRIWVHSHCYRADEILRLLDVAEHFGFRVAVLQHVLEGYRIVPEIFRHGCAASTFSDWWTYKIEAVDAVPQNAARLAQAGIAATVNSDSAELVRHLNLEAAKSIRFTGIAPNDAMRLCTLNGAITLGVADKAGSLDIGKWGDIAIFDGHPLDTFSRCVMTLVGGEVYFQQRGFLANTRIDSDSATAPTSHVTVAPPRNNYARLLVPPHRDVLHVPDTPGAVFAIRGARIDPISDNPIRDGTIVFSQAGIQAVGPRDKTPIPPGATVIEAAGLHVYPGLINASSYLGLSEIGSVAGSNDISDLGQFQPDLFAASAVNPHSEAISVTRCEGITTALVVPGGGTIAGRASLIHTAGWTMPEMLVAPESPGPLVLNLPTLPPDLPEEGRDKRLKDNRDAWKPIGDFFRRARLYADATRPGHKPPDWLHDTDDRFESMRPYVTGDAPVIVSADDVKAILEAVQFAERFRLRLIIRGADEAWKVADLLAARNIPVIIDGPMNLPHSRSEPWDSIYRNAAVLDSAGVRFCFGGGGASLVKLVATDAGMAVAHGLREDRALFALTLGAARILGVDKSIGSLESGKSADLIVANGNPCQATSQILGVFIAGRPCDMTSKHTRNDEKFLHRPAPALPPARTDLKGPPPMHIPPAR